MVKEKYNSTKFQKFNELFVLCTFIIRKLLINGINKITIRSILFFSFMRIYPIYPLFIIFYLVSHATRFSFIYSLLSFYRAFMVHNFENIVKRVPYRPSRGFVIGHSNCPVKKTEIFISPVE